MTADIDVLIIGAGHGGLGVAARLLARGREPLAVDANPRVGDAWRERWASLRLFTPRFVNGLPGMPFPDGDDPFPGKDEVADYQERYARERRIPLRLGTAVTRIRRVADAFEATLGGETVRARNVVITTGAHHTPRVPSFAANLDSDIRQLHSAEYGRAGTLPGGPVLVVGARNSGAEIAMDLAATHAVTLAQGAPRPYAPARWRSPGWWRVAQLRSWLLRGRLPPRVLPWPITVSMYVEVDVPRAAREGRIRLAPRIVDADGTGVRFADASVMRPSCVIWATGFRNDDAWIDVPSGENGIVVGAHCRAPAPGLWINRANLLGSLHWGSLDIAADVARSR